MRWRRQNAPTVRCKLSELKWPEACPVCLGEPEDLVVLTVAETDAPSESTNVHPSWQPGFSPHVPTVQPHRMVAFLIPVCEMHAHSVRTTTTKLVAAVAFFILMYPILFFSLATIRALRYGGPVLIPAVLLAGMILSMAGLVAYSALPRALERAIVVLKIDRGKGIVLLQLSNEQYLRRFLMLNGTNAVVIDGPAMVPATDDDGREV